MKTFEQKLQETISEKREEQWNRCQIWINQFGRDRLCSIFNTEYCPARCSQYEERIKLRSAYEQSNWVRV